MTVLSLVLLGLLALLVATSKPEGDEKTVAYAKLVTLIMIGIPFATLLAQLMN